MHHQFLHRRKAIDRLAATVVPNVLTDMKVFELLGLTRLFVEIAIAGEALTEFAIKARPNADAADVTLYDAAGDFTGPTGVLVAASGDLTALGDGNTGWFIIDTSGMHSLTIAARTAGGVGLLSVEAGGTN